MQAGAMKAVSLISGASGAAGSALSTLSSFFCENKERGNQSPRAEKFEADP